MAARPAWAHAAPDPLGASWTSFCETSQAYGNICGTLTRRGDSNTWDAKWTNKAVGVFTVSLSGHTITAQRSDPSGASTGASASYTGTINQDYTHVTGTVNWLAMTGAATGTSGPWEATVVGAAVPAPQLPANQT